MRFLILFIFFFISIGLNANIEENIDDIIKKSRVIDLKYSIDKSDCHKLTKIK